MVLTSYADWGWWRTVNEVGARTVGVAPKSRTRKLRARVGARVRRHEEPEGLEHPHT